MKKELLHFVEWKKIPEEKVDSTLEEVASWGVKKHCSTSMLVPRRQRTLCGKNGETSGTLQFARHRLPCFVGSRQ